MERSRLQNAAFASRKKQIYSTQLEHTFVFFLRMKCRYSCRHISHPSEHRVSIVAHRHIMHWIIVRWQSIEYINALEWNISPAFPHDIATQQWIMTEIFRWIYRFLIRNLLHLHKFVYLTRITVSNIGIVIVRTTIERAEKRDRFFVSCCFVSRLCVCVLCMCTRRR